IPMDEELWQVENYRDFLTERRKLLANAANRILDRLLHGEAPGSGMTGDIAHRGAEGITGGLSSDAEWLQRQECIDWCAAHGLPEPQVDYQVVDPDTREQIATFDLAWPDGLQEEMTEPVAVLINEPSEIEDMARRLSYHFFRTAAEFKQYALREALAGAEVVGVS
ncbi:MAG: hypothetical protein M1305_01910, partial [Candidatus Marsarchaeota archaeon]|nr:hypothetical protein [Candidatus Marsarchaeota archaeon]